MFLFGPRNSLLPLVVRRPAAEPFSGEVAVRRPRGGPEGVAAVPVQCEDGGAVAGAGDPPGFDLLDVVEEVDVVAHHVGHGLPGDAGRHLLPPVRGVAVELGQRVLEALVLLPRPPPGAYAAARLPAEEQARVRVARRRRHGRREDLHPRRRH